jgi:hypothetical protein
MATMPLRRKMTLTAQLILVATFASAMALPGPVSMGQVASTFTGEQSPQVQSSSPAALTPKNLPLERQAQSLFLWTPEVSPTPQALFDFKDSDIKFSLQRLMTVLRDSEHEGWVLAAYPDPKTSRPLIGAGFGLDVAATEHVQRDPLNPRPFLEPSTAQLWQAAGLDMGHLQTILNQFDRELKAWKKKNFRRKIKTHALSPQLTQEQALRLLRISTIQAIHNARAYCREFDQLTASQQMALSQLVFQMGVNLEEFVQFLGALNRDPNYQNSAQFEGAIETEAEHWKTVQHTLIDSDWARRYTTRAVTVIAMFDPEYASDPTEAKRQIRTAIHPVVGPHHKKRHSGSVQAANDTNSVAKIPHGTASIINRKQIPRPMPDRPLHP